MNTMTVVNGTTTNDRVDRQPPNQIQNLNTETQQHTADINNESILSLLIEAKHERLWL